MNTTTRSLLATVLACGLARQAPAQTVAVRDLAAATIEDLMQIVVTTASRVPEGLAAAPARVQVVTAAQIERRGYRSVLDVLKDLGRNAEAHRTAAHALKGAAGNLSAGGLYEAARVIERLGAEARMDAAEAACRQLSVEASNVIDVLRRHLPSAKEPTSCAS